MATTTTGTPDAGPAEDTELVVPGPEDVVSVRLGDLRETAVRVNLAWDAPEDTCESAARQLVEEVALAHAQKVAAWPDAPDRPGPREPDPLPLDALPASVRAWAESVAAAVQVPPDMTALLALSAISATSAGKVVVRVDDAWTREWVALYGVLVAKPGERKSPAFRHMTEPLRQWEADRQRELASRERAAEEVVDVAESRLRSVKKSAANGGADMEDVEAASLELEEARENVPTVPELLAQDSTPEALVRQMAEQGGRVAVLSPEGGPFRILDGRYSDGAARLEELAQAYDGEELRAGRISRDGAHVRTPALTLCVAIQPSVLDSIRNARSMRGQGIYGRITWVLPPSRMGERVDSSQAPALDPDARRDYRDTLYQLLQMEPRTVEEDGTPVPHVLGLSEAAAEAKAEYHYHVEEKLAPDGELRGMSDWAGKAVGRAVRIAALLELASKAGDGPPLTGEPISGWAMRSAVELCRALTTHARAVYGELEMDGRTADLRYLLARLRELPVGTSESELRRAVQGRKSIDGAEDVAELVDELEARGCVRRKHEPSDGPGRPSAPTLELHPDLCTDIAKNAKTSPETAEEAESGDKRNIRNADAGGDEGDGPWGVSP